jgi:HSP20 family protein
MQTTTLEKPTINDRAVRQEYVAPNVNIFETKDGYILQAEMPGVSKEGLDITLEGTEITITGRRTVDTVAGETLFRERNTADYRRMFELDPAIDTSKVSAKIEQGVLTVTLPKSEQVKPRKIKVD